MKLKVDGDSKCIYSKDEQPLKASFSIDVTEEGIEISFNDVHPKKQKALIFFNKQGLLNTNLVNLQHREKAFCSIFFIDE